MSSVFFPKFYNAKICVFVGLLYFDLLRWRWKSADNNSCCNYICTLNDYHTCTHKTHNNRRNILIVLKCKFIYTRAHLWIFACFYIVLSFFFFLLRLPAEQSASRHLKCKWFKREKTNLKASWLVFDICN